MPTGHVLHAVTLSAAPSLARRAAFLRPPTRLKSARGTPDVGRLELRGATVHFRTTPRQRDAWVRRLDRWIRYANSVVAE